MIEQHWIVLAGEEAGPKSNKMGGIWEVIDAEATTLASLPESDDLYESNILVLGPNYRYTGADWNTGVNRLTDMSELKPMEMGEELKSALDILAKENISVATGSRAVNDVNIGYLLFDCNEFDSIITGYGDEEMTLSNRVKREAYELAGLNSLEYEKTGYGREYTHYLNLSYAISEFVRAFVTIGTEKAKKYHDEDISRFAISLLPRISVSLHCHEFGVFYAIARLKKLGIPVRTVATLHATIPGRGWGYQSIEKFSTGDSTWSAWTPVGNAMLESLARYADVVTFVGDSTRKEAKLFHGLDGMVVRNGISTDRWEIDWDKKDRCREHIQNFVADNLKQFVGGDFNPKHIIPIFTISRIELENKGYPDLLDALIVYDRLLNSEVLSGVLEDDVRVVCFLITAHGPKSTDKLPEGFPINLPDEIVVGEELRLKKMVEERKLECLNLATSRRVAAIPYPQWAGVNDGALGLSTDEVMAGCVAGIFPSRYEPFLLTGLEAGKEATPSIVSRICGFSDALKSTKRLVTIGMGGVVVVDNIDLSYTEIVVDYALAIDYFTRTFLQDKVKYSLLSEEAYMLAKAMNWTDPVSQYYKMLVRDR